MPALLAGDTTGPLAVLPSVVAIVTIAIGVTRNAPGRRWPWVAIATSIGVWCAGDQFYAGLTRGGAAPSDRLDAMTLVGLLYLGGFVGLTAALLRLRRSHGNGLAPAGLLDTITVTVLLVLLIWVTVVSPAGPGPWALVDPTVVAFLIGDALIVATATRLAIVGPPSPATVALIGAAGAGLVADLAHSLAISGVTGALSPVEGPAAWLGVGCLGFAALDPSMVRLTEAPAEPARRLSLRRFWVVAVTALVAPVVLLVQAANGGVRDGVVLAVLGAALTIVALARVAATGDSQSRSLAYRARTDTLTGLANRAHLMRCLADGAEPPWSALLLIDLDEFRQFNDGEGPSAGDAVLVDFGRPAATPRRPRRRGGPLRRRRVRHPRRRRLPGLRGAGRRRGHRDRPAGAGRRASGPDQRLRRRGRRAIPPAAGELSDDELRAEAEDLVRRAGLALRAAKEGGPGEWSRVRLGPPRRAHGPHAAARVAAPRRR